MFGLKHSLSHKEAKTDDFFENWNNFFGIQRFLEVFRPIFKGFRALPSGNTAWKPGDPQQINHVSGVEFRTGAQPLLGR